jgi:hypothetical protein
MSSVPKAIRSGLVPFAKRLIYLIPDPASGYFHGTKQPILSLTDHAVKLIEKERRVGFPSEKN